ncbi:hypothetical protein J6590_100192, partial [Homalodisca vitripennis]
TKKSSETVTMATLRSILLDIDLKFPACKRGDCGSSEDWIDGTVVRNSFDQVVPIL